jgi:hyaluronoglucosaminidase
MSWRDPYPASTQRNFDKEIAQAADEGVQWIPNISPARGNVDDPRRICFTCPGDLDAMVAKLTPFLEAGSRTVMVSFDDIAAQLGPADAAAYAARYPNTPPEYQFGRATADFLNGLLLRLPAGTTLLTVLPDYSGTVDSPYLQGTRDGALNPAIGVLWTGPHIRASKFTAADAAAYAGLVGRTPIMWENWVTRDFVPSRLFLGPFRARQEVVGSVQGFFFNPMNEPDLNMLPLATAGDWMQDPDKYRARRSWKAAVKELARGRQPEVAELRAFAETNYSSGLMRTEAPTSFALQNDLIRLYSRGARWPEAADALAGELTLVRRAPRGLRKLPDRRIARQAMPFLRTADRLATAGQHGLDLLRAERPSLTITSIGNGFDGTALPPDPDAAAALREQVASEWAAARTSPLYVYGCRVTTRGCGSRPFNRMDDFLTKVTALDAAWAPNADLAAARRQLQVTFRGKRVKHGLQGRFTLPADSCGARVLVTDGAGGETSLPLPPCPKKAGKHAGA